MDDNDDPKVTVTDLGTDRAGAPYMGHCFRCTRQFMSDRDRVYKVQATGWKHLRFCSAQCAETAYLGEAC